VSVGFEATLSAAKNFLVHDAICHDFALIRDKGRTQKENMSSQRRFVCREEAFV
jgi:hypothetical protein